MKNWIIKSNDWYDSLPEPKRSLFFLAFIMSTLLVAQYFMIVKVNSIGKITGNTVIEHIYIPS